MGRLGVSYLEVAKAANELHQKGAKPTVDGVRALLGTGSKSTIVPYLRQWRFSQIENMEATGQLFSTVQLLSLVKSLYEHLQQKEGRIKTRVESKELPDLLGIKVELMQKLEAERALTQRLQKEILALQIQLTLSEKKRLHLLAEKANLKEELRELTNI